MASSSSSQQDKIIDALMQLIARDGWPAARIDAIARESGIDAAEIVAAFGCRMEMLAAFGRRADVAALRAADADGGSQAIRDRLFDILMARFDVLSPHKPAIQQLAQGSRADPALAAFFLCRLPQSMERLASAAGVTTAGLLGAARVKALAALYLGVARVWLADDSEDMAKTMAALDKALARAHRWETAASRWRSPRLQKSSDNIKEQTV